MFLECLFACLEGRNMHRAGSWGILAWMVLGGIKWYFLLFLLFGTVFYFLVLCYFLVLFFTFWFSVTFWYSFLLDGSLLLFGSIWYFFGLFVPFFLFGTFWYYLVLFCYCLFACLKRANMHRGASRGSRGILDGGLEGGGLGGIIWVTSVLSE